MEAVYFALVKQYLTHKINDFGDRLLGNTISFVTSIAVIVLTLIILTKGFRILTGRSQESLMGLVLEMSRNSFIVAAATTMAVGNIPIKQMLLTDMPNNINMMVSGSDESPEDSIDKNLVYTAVAMAAMDGAQGLNDGISADNVASAGSAKLIAALGVAGPPMTAGAMLLMYTFAINLFVGLGPIFILCLLHDSTRQLFHGWFKYGLATMFSLAVLSFMTSLVMELMLRVAAALWASSAITSLLSLGDGASAGLTSQAMQQGGIGLLMTVLLVTAPPMAAQFFGATIGNFSPYSGVSAGGSSAQPNASGYPGSPGYMPSGPTSMPTADRAGTARQLPALRGATSPQSDTVDLSRVGPFSAPPAQNSQREVV